MRFGQGHRIALPLFGLVADAGVDQVEQFGIAGDPLGHFDPADFGTDVSVEIVNVMWAVFIEDLGATAVERSALAGAQNPL